MEDKLIIIAPAFVLGLDKVLDKVSEGNTAKFSIYEIDYIGKADAGDGDYFRIKRKVVD